MRKEKVYIYIYIYIYINYIYGIIIAVMHLHVLSVEELLRDFNPLSVQFPCKQVVRIFILESLLCMINYFILMTKQPIIFG